MDTFHCLFVILVGFSVSTNSLESFSCDGRPSGYYADIISDCQQYHVCNGGKRQYTYSCPNTTRFQQRMMICDHEYLVDCERSEQDFSANLLIGQRGVPFVRAEDLLPKQPPQKSFRSRPIQKQNYTAHVGAMRLPSTSQYRPIAPANTSSALFQTTPKSAFHQLPPARYQIPKDVFPRPFMAAVRPVTEHNQENTPKKTDYFPASAQYKQKIADSSGKLITTPSFSPPTPKTRSFSLYSSTTAIPPTTQSFFPVRTTQSAKSSFKLPVSFTFNPPVPHFPKQLSDDTRHSNFSNPDNDSPFLEDNSVDSRSLKHSSVLKLEWTLPDTRAMLFIPDRPEDAVVPNIKKYSVTIPQPRMNFKDPVHVAPPVGPCPGHCNPAFMQPGSCLPCVVIK